MKHDDSKTLRSNQASSKASGSKLGFPNKRHFQETLLSRHSCARSPARGLVLSPLAEPSARTDRYTGQTDRERERAQPDTQDRQTDRQRERASREQPDTQNRQRERARERES